MGDGTRGQLVESPALRALTEATVAEQRFSGLSIGRSKPENVGRERTASLGRTASVE